MNRIHSNSVASYWQGSLDLFGKRHQQVIRALRASALPMTDREVMIALGFSDPNCVRPRLSELIDAGLAYECGDRECPVTRKRVRLVRLVTREAQAEFEMGEVLTEKVIDDLRRKAG